jgi:hypothetical protein
MLSEFFMLSQGCKDEKCARHGLVWLPLKEHRMPEKLLQYKLSGTEGRAARLYSCTWVKSGSAKQEDLGPSLACVIYMNLLLLGNLLGHED